MISSFPQTSHASASHASTGALPTSPSPEQQATVGQVAGGQAEGGENRSDTDAIVEKARDIIWNHSQLRTIGVEEVAKQLPVTRRTLDRRFAHSVGHTVLDEINICRLQRAKMLLRDTDLLIKRVAHVAGFPSRERMRLLFLREEGVSPSQYRERFKGSSESS